MNSDDDIEILEELCQVTTIGRRAALVILLSLIRTLLVVILLATP